MNYAPIMGYFAAACYSIFFRSTKVLSRRSFLSSGACVFAAPFVNRGSSRLFAATYSTTTVDLVRESTVIDMLGLVTLDFKKLDSWRAHPENFREADFQRLKDSGITVFHPAVGYTQGDIYAESSADIAVHHLGAVERAAALADAVTMRLGDRLRDCYITEIGAVVAAHVGPGVAGVVVHRRS